MREWLEQKIAGWSDMADKRCIVVDGDNGVGKSRYIAPIISRILSASIVSVDQYLLENGAPYLDQIRWDELKADVLAKSPTVVIEGLCMLSVMARIQIPYDYHIFVKRFQNAHWENEHWLETRAKEPKSKTTRDLVNYYKACKPFEFYNKNLEVD